MSWRNHAKHSDETAAVRRALAAAGIDAQVGHGQGTAWSWLEINIGAGEQWGEHLPPRGDRQRFCEGAEAGCARCINLRIMGEETHRIVREVTGRDGDHNGNILVLTQGAWKRKDSRIVHPRWRNRIAEPAGDALARDTAHCDACEQDCEGCKLAQGIEWRAGQYVRLSLQAASL